MKLKKPINLRVTLKLENALGELENMGTSRRIH